MQIFSLICNIRYNLLLLCPTFGGFAEKKIWNELCYKKKVGNISEQKYFGFPIAYLIYRIKNKSKEKYLFWFKTRKKSDEEFGFSAC